MFKRKAKKETASVTIREGISGYYHYHIAIHGEVLCGNKHTMSTEIKLATW